METAALLNASESNKSASVVAAAVNMEFRNKHFADDVIFALIFHDD